MVLAKCRREDGLKACVSSGLRDLAIPQPFIRMGVVVGVDRERFHFQSPCCASRSSHGSVRSA